MNLVLYVDNNNYQSLGKTSQTHPSFYPLTEKFKSFKWDVKKFMDITPNNYLKHLQLGNKKPLVVIAETIKGYPVEFMIDNPIWHYRSPNNEELKIAYKEIENK